MAVTNHAVGQSINLASVLNTKLEAPLHQSEMGLDVQASLTGQAIRFDEFSSKHNNDGTFKAGIIVNADINSSAGISASKLSIRQNYNKSTISNPSTTLGTFGTALVLTPPTGFLGLFPEAIDIVYGGTFGSETVTAQITATYSDTTTGVVTKTATAVETVSFTNSDLMSLIKDGVYITQTSFQSQSTIANSAVTVTFNRCGLYL